MPANIPDPDLAATIANVTSSLVMEQRERKNRQINLILHNVSESKSTDLILERKRILTSYSQSSQMC